MALSRDERNVGDPGNPLTVVRHTTQHSDGACLGLTLWIWCPGCQALHMPRFRCPTHRGPKKGPMWLGNPYSDPLTISPSLLIFQTSVTPRCHSFIRNGNWEYLSDSTHLLAGKTVPVEPLPNWVVREFEED